MINQPSLTSYDFDWVSAFSDKAFGGNGCVVVYGASELNLETRLNIVKETSLSECTFVEPSDVADFQFRIYLASREIPFAGHPTLAGVASLMHRELLTGTQITIETQAGIVPLEILEGGVISMTQRAPQFGMHVPVKLVADAVSLSSNDIIETPQVVSTGLPFTVAVVRDYETLLRAKLDVAMLNRMADEIDAPDGHIMEPFLVTLEDSSFNGDTFSRILLAPPNPAQDPFTGSATGAMASYLWSKSLIDQPKFVAQQGHDMGRPGEATVQVLGSRSDITGVKLAGKAYVTMSGQIHL